MGIMVTTALCSRTRLTEVVFEVHFDITKDHRLACGNCYSFGPLFPSVSLKAGHVVTSFCSKEVFQPYFPQFCRFDGERCLLFSCPTLPDRGGVLELPSYYAVVVVSGSSSSSIVLLGAVMQLGTLPAEVSLAITMK